MAKQTLVFESAKELSLNNGMLAITDKDSGEITLRSLEDVHLRLCPEKRYAFPDILRQTDKCIFLANYLEIIEKLLIFAPEKIDDYGIYN